MFPHGPAIWTRPLEAMYDCLAPAQPPCSADAIFVYAGQQERKEYGVALWRQGLAPTLLLSVGRFEWRRVPALGLPSDGGLTPLVQGTPPTDRHFVLAVDPRGARAWRVPPGRFGTAAETDALLREAAARGFRSVLAVSAAPHLRRVRIALRRLSGEGAPRFVLVAVPEERTALSRARWWTRGETRRVLAGEALKCCGYALLPRGLLVPRRPPPA